MNNLLSINHSGIKFPVKRPVNKKELFQNQERNACNTSNISIKYPVPYYIPVYNITFTALNKSVINKEMVTAIRKSLFGENPRLIHKFGDAVESGHIKEITLEELNKVFENIAKQENTVNLDAEENKQITASLKILTKSLKAELPVEGTGATVGEFVNCDQIKSVFKLLKSENKFIHSSAILTMGMFIKKNVLKNKTYIDKFVKEVVGVKEKDIDGATYAALGCLAENYGILNKNLSGKVLTHCLNLFGNAVEDGHIKEASLETLNVILEGISSPDDFVASKAMKVLRQSLENGLSVEGRHVKKYVKSFHINSILESLESKDEPRLTSAIRTTGLFPKYGWQESIAGKHIRLIFNSLKEQNLNLNPEKEQNKHVIIASVKTMGQLLDKVMKYIDPNSIITEITQYSYSKYNDLAIESRIVLNAITKINAVREKASPEILNY